MSQVSRNCRFSYSGQQPAIGFRCLIRIGMLLIVLGCGWMVMRADAEEALSTLAQSGSDRIERYGLGFWIGSGLIGLGLIGGLGGLLFHQRHRLRREEQQWQEERDRFHRSAVAQHDRQRELEDVYKRQP